MKKGAEKGNQIMIEIRKIQTKNAQDFLHQKEIKVKILGRGKEKI